MSKKNLQRIEGKTAPNETVAETQKKPLSADQLTRVWGARSCSRPEPLFRVLPQIAFVAVLILAGVLLLSYMFVDKSLARFLPDAAARFALYLMSALGISGYYSQREARLWNKRTAEELNQRRPSQLENAASAPQTAGVTGTNNPNQDDEWEKTAVVMAHP